MRPSLCLPLLAGLALAGAPARAADVPEAFEVKVAVEVDASALESAGRFTLVFAFEVGEPPGRACRIRVAIARGEKVLFERDHAPPSDTAGWRKGQRVRYPLPSVFPVQLLGPELEGELAVRVGFLDLETGKRVLPAGDGRALDGMRAAGSFRAPRREEELSAAAEEALVKEAEALGRAKRGLEAWERLEFALRRTSSYAQKRRLRAAIERLGPVKPRELSEEELGIVRSRVRAEKSRWLREVAGQMFDRRQYHGARRILRDVGGLLEENNREAVVGALAEARRAEKDAQGVEEKIVAQEAKKAEAAIAALARTPEWQDERKLPAVAKKLAVQGQRGAAWEAARRAKDSAHEETAAQGRALQAEIERAMLEDVPEAEKKAVEAAHAHPAWGRIAWQPSHKFIYIGPKTLVEGLVKNTQSTLRFDLAYVFQTDLFGTTPNPGGDRLTVFFKELWDFGGGVGGGKIIDLGRADPQRADARVDNGLLYHELTHNLYTVVPGYPGFTEGIANFGAVFTMDVLDQTADSLHSFKGNLEAFRQDYLKRDLEFWRIQNYGPSAGFFLHFVEQYGKKDGRWDWNLYRQFFRGYNRLAVRDGRAGGAIRGIAHELVRVFGPAALDDLVRFRFPLGASDREAIVAEIAAGEGSSPPWAAEPAGHASHPGSPAHRDKLYREYAALKGGPESELVRFARGRLGILYDWRVAGPFLENTGESFCEAFPPERGEIDFAKRYEYPKHAGVWRVPAREAGKYVTAEPGGWVAIEYAYGDHTSSYAWCRLKVPTARRAALHLRADDHLTVWFDGRLVYKMPQIGEPGSTPHHWRGAWGKVPDQIAVPIALPAGTSGLLLKITNVHGPAGFIAAVTGEDGRAFPDLETDAEAPGPPPPPPKKAWRAVAALAGRDLAPLLQTTVGAWRVRTQALHGAGTGGAVEWRKYTVRPGFPKDSPSNLAWLPASLTRKLDDFRLELVLRHERKALPKLTLTFDGEGGRDGLAGWTLIFLPGGGGKTMRVHLEKYDHLVYRSPDLPVSPAERHVVQVERLGERFAVRIGDQRVFERIHVPPIRPAGGTSDRLGLATWGPEPAIESLALAR